MTLKNRIADLITAKPFVPLWRSFDPSAGGAVLMFHRVSPRCDRELDKNNDLNVSPQYLDTLISSFKKSGYAFVTADELAERVESHKNCRRIACITFDDGYHDFLRYALPVLESGSVPAVIYVNTAPMKREHFFWWLLLEEIVLKHPVLELPGFGTLSCRTKKLKNSVFWTLRNHLVGFSPDQIDERIKALFRQYLPEDISCFYQAALSADDVKTLKRHNLITLGNHTHGHVSCALTSLDEVKADIRKCQAVLQRDFGIAPRHFAYPYGLLPERRTRLQEFLKEEMRFRTAVTTYEGVLGKFTLDSPYALPRIMASELHAFSAKQMEREIALTNARALLIGRKP